MDTIQKSEINIFGKGIDAPKINKTTGEMDSG